MNCDKIYVLKNKEARFMENRFETFTKQIAKISRNIRKIKTEEMEEFKLKSPHVSCLYYLYKQNGTMTAKELCDVCDEDKAALSRSVDFLESNGYLVCQSRTQKRYKSPLALTEKGKQIGKQLVDKIDNILHLISSDLSDEDREVFYKSLIIISENLQKFCDNYGE